MPNAGKLLVCETMTMTSNFGKDLASLAIISDLTLCFAYLSLWNHLDSIWPHLILSDLERLVPKSGWCQPVLPPKWLRAKAQQKLAILLSYWRKKNIPMGNPNQNGGVWRFEWENHRTKWRCFHKKVMYRIYKWGIIQRLIWWGWLAWSFTWWALIPQEMFRMNIHVRMHIRAYAVNIYLEHPST